MAKKGTDERVAASEQNVAVQQGVNQALLDMGIQDAEDLGPGRADIGLIAQRMNQPEAEMDPDAMDEAIRDAEWEKSVESPEQPYQPRPNAPSPAAPETPATEAETPTLAQLQAERDAAQAEAKRMKDQYARESEKWGNERKRVAERLARLEHGGNAGGFAPQAPAYAPPQPNTYYDPRILGDTDPNTPLSAGQTAALLHSMAAAFGQQMSARDQSVIEAAREMRNYDLTSNEEADLIERHGWLATLDRASQIKAMRDLVTPLRAASQPVAPAPPVQPRGVDMAALARARHLTATTFIEPSSRTSTQEQAAATGVDSALAKKIAEYKEAMAARPGQPNFEIGQYGENKKAERLLREINALQRRRI